MISLVQCFCGEFRFVYTRGREYHIPHSTIESDCSFVFTQCITLIFLFLECVKRNSCNTCCSFTIPTHIHRHTLSLCTKERTREALALPPTPLFYNRQPRERERKKPEPYPKNKQNKNKNNILIFSLLLWIGCCDWVHFVVERTFDSLYPFVFYGVHAPFNTDALRSWMSYLCGNWAQWARPRHGCGILHV